MVKLWRRGKDQGRYKPKNAPVIVGFDVGQRPDPSAAVFTERWVENVGEPEFIEKPRLLGEDGWFAQDGETEAYSRQHVRLGYDVRHIETARDKPYPDQAKNLVSALHRQFKARSVVLVVDDTGVGRAMTDELRYHVRQASAGGARITLLPVTITAGNVSHFDKEHWRWYVPKFELINAAVIALEDGRLQWGTRVRGWEELEGELRNYKRKVHLHTGKASYDTGLLWREGAHDDRVLALSLAIWLWEKNRGRYVDTPLDGGTDVTPEALDLPSTPV